MSTKSVASIALMMTMLPGCAFPLFPGYDLEECDFEETCDGDDDDDDSADEDETAEDEADEDDDGESPPADEAEEEEKDPEPAVFTKAGSWVGTCFIKNGAEVEVELVIGDDGLGHMDLEHASSTFSVAADGWSDGDVHEVIADVGEVQFRLDLTTDTEEHLEGSCEQLVAERVATGGGGSTAGQVICTIFTLGLANCGGGTPSHQTRWVVEHEGELALVEMG